MLPEINNTLLMIYGALLLLLSIYYFGSESFVYTSLLPAFQGILTQTAKQSKHNGIAL
jgi:hypothetical protein